MNLSHSSLVESVTSALEDGDMKEDGSGDDDFSDGDDVDMFNDECLDNDMTLNQYQDKVTRVPHQEKLPCCESVTKEGKGGSREPLLLSHSSPV